MFHGTPRKEIHGRVADLLLDVKLDHTYLNRFPMQMSGGERQRVAIARAIAAEPDLVLCDEIVSSLDVSVQAEVLDLLRALQTERGIAFLFITHDLAVVRSLAHRVIVLYGGEMMETGLIEEVFTPPTHPYTHVLLSAVPDVDPTKSIRNVEGMTTDLIVDVTGKSACAFAGSCPWKLGKICDDEEPPQRQVSESNIVRCHIPLDELKDREQLFHDSLSGFGGDGTSSPDVSPG
jgi:peptide/nickel transport system ATP-binding protein